eukprot:Skav204452  [mRNA]  locus=scaffold1298:288157:300048:+ [translate_table: standard]
MEERIAPIVLPNLSTAADSQLAHGDLNGMSTVAEESLMAIRTVCAFGGEESALQRFEAELMRAKIGGTSAPAHPGTKHQLWRLPCTHMHCHACHGWDKMGRCKMWTFMYALIYAATLWLGGHAPMEESRNVVVVMISLIVGVAGISQFSGHAPTMARALASAKNMKKVMRCTAHEIEPENFELTPLPEAIQVIETLEFRSVSFRYPMRPEQMVLKNLNLHVKKGQKIAMVGESGCGKSTTIQLLERFYDPEAGQILVNGMPLFQLPAAKDAQIYDALSALPQQLDSFVGLGGATGES